MNQYFRLIRPDHMHKHSLRLCASARNFTDSFGKTTYHYDSLNRLIDLSNFNSSDNLLSSYTYTLAPNGRRSAIAEQTLKDDNLTFSTRNIAYTHDRLYRCR